MKERLSLTPGTPRFTARRLETPEDKVNPEDHETYRSGVGTLLYLTKHSRPDICNPVRELSKTMDAPAPVHLKEMYKVVRHVFVGSPQVSFLICTLEIPQNNAVQVLCS